MKTLLIFTKFYIQVLHPTNEKEWADAISTDLYVLADFYAELITFSLIIVYSLTKFLSWCGPCRVLGPVLETLANEQPAGKAQWILIKANVDKLEDASSSFGVKTTTAKNFKNFKN